MTRPVQTRIDVRFPVGCLCWRVRRRGPLWRRIRFHRQAISATVDPVEGALALARLSEWLLRLAVSLACC